MDFEHNGDTHLVLAWDPYITVNALKDLNDMRCHVNFEFQ